MFKWTQWIWARHKKYISKLMFSLGLQRIIFCFPILLMIKWTNRPFLRCSQVTCVSSCSWCGFSRLCASGNMLPASSALLYLGICGHCLPAHLLKPTSTDFPQVKLMTPLYSLITSINGFLRPLRNLLLLLVHLFVLNYKFLKIRICVSHLCVPWCELNGSFHPEFPAWPSPLTYQWMFTTEEPPVDPGLRVVRKQPLSSPLFPVTNWSGSRQSPRARPWKRWAGGSREHTLRPRGDSQSGGLAREPEKAVRNKPL